MRAYCASNLSFLCAGGWSGVRAQRHHGKCVVTARAPKARNSRVLMAPSSELRDSARLQGPLRAIRDFLDGIRRVSGLAPEEEARILDLDSNLLFEEEDQPPEVLVVGATGETGRIIVRKLLLRGYKVRVLVRDLFSSTLSILGTGVSYVKGHLHHYDSLLEATADVDKVICTIGAKEELDSERVEYHGVCNLISAFHDARVQYYGRAEATKLVLFNFGKDHHLARWKRVVRQIGEEDARAPRTNFQKTASNRVAFMGQIFSKYSGTAEIRTDPLKLNLRNFSGLILRCIGDGKEFTVVLRTANGVRNGIEYFACFKTKRNKWDSVRIPLSTFETRAIQNNTADAVITRNISDAPALDRRDIRQIAIQYSKPSVYPERDDGRFYLGVDYLKAYRMQEQPDFVLVSCASVSSRDLSELDEAGLREIASTDRIAWKYMAENRLRKSGLTYCIVRPGQFTDMPGGNKAIMLEQGGDVSGAISRADLAEICVKSLLDPRACNVTFDAFESMYAPTARTPSQDVSSMLGRLQPNT